MGSLIYFGLMGAPSHGAVTFKKDTILRDAETESALKELIDPIFKVAKLNSKNLKIVLVATPEINAAATVGPMIIINTGLLLKCNRVEELAGVLAHETGHIAGGHIVRTEDLVKRSSIPVIASMVLGAAAGIASGRADAGLAAASLGMEMTNRSFLHYSRGQEASADQAALRFLDALHWTSDGLVDFMNTLKDQDLLTEAQQDPYAQTHPMASDRLTTLTQHQSQSPYKGISMQALYILKFKRIKAKLKGFMDTPGSTITSLKPDTPESRYSLAIAYFRQGDLQKGTDLINGLIKSHPEDAYYHDLKGQMLFENGKIEEAIQSYRKAHSLKPKEPLIGIALAQVLLEQQQSNPQESLDLLKLYERDEKDESNLWRLKAIAYGRMNDIGMAALSLGEESLVQGDFKNAGNQGKRALMHLKDKASRQRAKDIVLLAKKSLKDSLDEKHDDDS